MADYTLLTAEEIGGVCRLYGLDRRRSQHIDGGMANSSYLVHCTQGNYVLTVLDNHDTASARQRVSSSILWITSSATAFPPVFRSRIRAGST